MAEGSSVGGQATVAGEAPGFLHTASLVAAQRAVAAAVSGAARPDPRGDPSPLLQVQGLSVQPQRADAAPEALLSGCCASLKKGRPRQVVHKPTLQHKKHNCSFLFLSAHPSVLLPSHKSNAINSLIYSGWYIHNDSVLDSLAYHLWNCVCDKCTLIMWPSRALSS